MKRPTVTKNYYTGYLKKIFKLEILDSAKREATRHHKSNCISLGPQLLKQ